MKKSFDVTMRVEVEIDDKYLSEMLPAFNEHFFDTDARGLLSHLATMTAREFDFVEGVGHNGKEFKAKVVDIETEVA